MKLLEGYKTYITAFLFAVFNFGVSMGYWAADDTIVHLINSLLGALGFAFLRSGVNKKQKKITK